MDVSFQYQIPIHTFSACKITKFYANIQINPNLFLFSIKKHPDPVMGRGYINVRATGGAVKSLANDWREI